MFFSYLKGFVGKEFVEMSVDNVGEVDKPLFRALDPDDPDPEATVIDSLCMNCHEQVIFSRMFCFVSFSNALRLFFFKGSDSATADCHPILQRSGHNVICLHALRFREQPNSTWWNNREQGH